MKLTFKMKVKLSLFVAFVFIIALIIHEDHAGVVLKRFKPKRALSFDKKPKLDSGISTKTAPKLQVKDKDEKKSSTDTNGEVSIIRNSTGFSNETVVKLETISRDVLLNSSVIYEVTKDTVSNSKTSKLSRSLSPESGANINYSNCSKLGLSISENDQNCSATHLSTTSNISAEISETKENSPQGLVEGLNSVVQDLFSDEITGIPVSSEKFSSDSIVSQSENDKLQTISDNRTADQPRNETKIDIALKQPAKNNTQSMGNVSHPSVSDHLNVSNVNLKDAEIIANDSSAMQLVNKSEILQKSDDSSSSEKILTNEILNQTDHESIASAGLDFSAHSEVTKNDSSLTQIVNESQILHEKDGSSGSEDVSTNETLLNQTGLESIVSAGLDFLAHSEVAKNAVEAMEIFNLSDSSLTDHIIDDNVIDLVLPSQPIQNNLVAETASSEIEDTKNDLNPSNKINESNVDTDKTEIDLDVLPADKKKCPPPGICVFWFMARNTCTNDSQCLDSKICCRVRCSKKCIDV